MYMWDITSHSCGHIKDWKALQSFYNTNICVIDCAVMNTKKWKLLCPCVIWGTIHINNSCDCGHVLMWQDKMSCTDAGESSSFISSWYPVEWKKTPQCQTGRGAPLWKLQLSWTRWMIVTQMVVKNLILLPNKTKKQIQRCTLHFQMKRIVASLA